MSENEDADDVEDENPTDSVELIDRGRAVEFMPADYFARQLLTDIFPRPGPLEIDLGSGEGAFIIAMAKRHPERNFLGVERLLGRVRKVCRAIARNGALTRQALLQVHLHRVSNLAATSTWSLRALLEPSRHQP